VTQKRKSVAQSSPGKTLGRGPTKETDGRKNLGRMDGSGARRGRKTKTSRNWEVKDQRILGKKGGYHMGAGDVEKMKTMGKTRNFVHPAKVKNLQRKEKGSRKGMQKQSPRTGGKRKSVISEKSLQSWKASRT